MILPPGLIALMGFTIFFIATLGIFVALTLYYGYLRGNRYTLTEKESSNNHFENEENFSNSTDFSQEKQALSKLDQNQA